MLTSKQEVENNDISEQLRFAALHDCETKWKTCDSHGGAKDHGYVLIHQLTGHTLKQKPKQKQLTIRGLFLEVTLQRTSSAHQLHSSSVVCKLNYVDELLVEPAKLRAQWRWNLTISLFLSLARAR